MFEKIRDEINLGKKYWQFHLYRKCVINVTLSTNLESENKFNSIHNSCAKFKALYDIKWSLVKNSIIFQRE